LCTDGEVTVTASAVLWAGYVIAESERE